MNRLTRIAALAPAVLLCLAAAGPGRRLHGQGGRGGQQEDGQGVGLRRPARPARASAPASSSRRDGYVLTANAQLLDTRDLRVHLWDGTKYHAEIVAQEPELDVALIKISPATTRTRSRTCRYFDLDEAAKRPPVDVGTEVLAFSNCFEIATRDDPVSVQHAVVTAYAKLQGRNGFYEMPFTGKVYMVDAVTNNPGAAGGALTTRKGELIGMIGRGLRNELTGTWMNYSIPINGVAEVTQPDGKTAKTSMVDVWLQEGEVRQGQPQRRTDKPGRTFDRSCGR